jgi:hypothetical protein
LLLLLPASAACSCCLLPAACSCCLLAPAAAAARCGCRPSGCCTACVLPLLLLVWVPDRCPHPRHRHASVRAHARTPSPSGATPGGKHVLAAAHRRHVLAFSVCLPSMPQSPPLWTRAIASPPPLLTCAHGAGLVFLCACGHARVREGVGHRASSESNASASLHPSCPSPCNAPPPSQTLPGEGTLLHGMVTSYLREQHRSCVNPSTTLPPLPLLRPHRCPDNNTRATRQSRSLVSRVWQQVGRGFAWVGGWLSV